MSGAIERLRSHGHAATVAVGRCVDRFTELVSQPSQYYRVTGGTSIYTLANASVRPWIIVASSLPLILLTRASSLFQLRTTALVLLNVWVRLVWPSCYYPATASVRHPVASPITARCIAFLAEFHFYETVASWYGLDFWGQSTHLWAVVLLGELISTLGVLLQSELVLFCEDCIWCLHAVVMAYFAPLSIPLFLWAGGLSLVHLPRRYRLYMQRTGSWVWQGFPPPVMTRQCDEAEKAWVVPMLIGQALLSAMCYASANL
jgi:hypothetical protein